MSKRRCLPESLGKPWKQIAVCPVCVVFLTGKSWSTAEKWMEHGHLIWLWMVPNGLQPQGISQVLVIEIWTDMINVYIYICMYWQFELIIWFAWCCVICTFASQKLCQFSPNTTFESNPTESNETVNHWKYNLVENWGIIPKKIHHVLTLRYVTTDRILLWHLFCCDLFQEMGFCCGHDAWFVPKTSNFLLWSEPLLQSVAAAFHQASYALSTRPKKVWTVENNGKDWVLWVE